jgi:hypothetical protein
MPIFARLGKKGLEVVPRWLRGRFCGRNSLANGDAEGKMRLNETL